MDELEISGKRYISSRRAAKEHKYHSDYIGQLIRAKKVAGTKVGRAWYVEIESLAAYFNQEPHNKIEAVSAPSKVVYVAPEKKELTKPMVRHISPISIYETVENEFVEKSKPVLQMHTSTLQYVPQNEPLFPAIRKQPYVAATQKIYTPTEQTRTRNINQTRTKERPWVALLVVLILGTLTFMAAGFLSSQLVSTTTIIEGQASSVGISF